VSLARFTQADVAELLGADEGENDGANWVVYGRLKDGRYFFISAGCDYTGWDCQQHGDSCVAETLDDIITFGMGDGDRDRLLPLAAELS